MSINSRHCRKTAPAFLAVQALTVALVAQTPPRFTSVAVLPEGDARVLIETSAGGSYRLEASSDVAHWLPLVTFRGAASVEQVDAAAPYLGMRVYRAVQLAEGGVFFGDHLPTADGDAVIRPLNHASFVISWNGLAIYFDPVSAAGPFTDLPKADIILITHGHGDHLDPGALATLQHPGTTMVAPAGVKAGLADGLKALTTSLNNGQQTDLLGLTVEAVAAYNANHTKGAGNGYVVTLGEKRLYVSGDTGDTPEMRELADIDVAFVCMNLPYTMAVTEAASVVRHFRPRIVYPYHYRNQGGTLADVQMFKRLVGHDLGIVVRLRDWY